jgi:hypothetical protein
MLSERGKELLRETWTEILNILGEHIDLDLTQEV